MTQFDYGEKLPDGQFTNHPTKEDGEFIRPIRSVYRHEKCGVTTYMGKMIAETYAKNPDFYSKTFCAACHDYFPVGSEGEFSWLDGTKVGT